MLHGAFGVHVGDPAEERRIVIEFTRDKAALVSARRWHPTQVIEDAADGGVVLAFTVTNLTPVVSWILEWGPHARVLEPRELVERVTAELDQARARYK